MHNYSTREFQVLLRRNGFKFVRQNGDHLIYKRGEETLTITNNGLNKMIAQRLMKEHNLNNHWGEKRWK